MTCSPSHLASRSVAFPERERIRSQLISLLEKLGCEGPLDELLSPSASNTAASNTAASNTAASNTAASNTAASNTAASNTAASNTAASNTAASNTTSSNTTVAATSSYSTRDAALATALMDSFRKTRDPEAFDGLVRWAGPQLQARVRSRLRSLGALLDPSEVWQDTIVNIYRYPDRFLAARPGAFAAWSSTIVDNAIRRHLRRSKRDLGMTLRDPEVLQEQADTSTRDPSTEAENNEECLATASAFGLILQAYLLAFHRLGERERFVLQMVEVRSMRYAELAQILGIRPEALKMVVFRARKRIHEQLHHQLAGTQGTASQVSRAKAGDVRQVARARTATADSAVA